MLFHPVLTNPKYTTILLSWFDGGLHLLEPLPPDGEGLILLDTYYFSYLLCFLLAGFYGRYWYKTRSLKVLPYHVLDLVGFGILGVLVGAKTTYVLFYNLEYYLKHPADIFLNWSGMASHGALAGACFFLILYSWKAKLSIYNVLDHASFAAATGPIFIRFGNFLNAELFGRSTTMPWGMHFPLKSGLGESLFINAQNKVFVLGLNDTLSPYQGPLAGAYENFSFILSQLPEQIYRIPVENNGVDTFARLITDPRHPSQFYQLIVSGVVVLSLLFYIKSKAKHVGTITASFFIAWGGTRILMEFFRQQDVQRSEGLFAWMSMGQVLSLIVVALGIYMLKQKRPRLSELPDPLVQITKSENQ